MLCSLHCSLLHYVFSCAFLLLCFAHRTALRFCSLLHYVFGLNKWVAVCNSQLKFFFRYPHYRPWRPTGDVDARVHILTATTLGRGRVASPTLGRLNPEESPQYSFYRRLSGPQDQSGHERAKKNLHPSDTRDWTRAIQPVAQRLAAWDTWPTSFYKKLMKSYLRSTISEDI